MAEFMQLKNALIQKSHHHTSTLNTQPEDHKVEDEKDERKKRQRRDKIERIPKRGITNPTSSLPEEFQREIAKRSGVSPKTSTRMIIQKRLEKTDLNKNHGRISIPCSQVETFEFLTDEEMTCLRKEETITVRLIHKPKKKMKNGMDMPLIETPIGLRQWNLHKSMGDPEKVNPQYVLRTGWNKVVLEDGFVRGDFVQIWAFRDAQDNLSMALVKVDEQEDAETLT
ncbi:B3 domain-containing protein [Senna tora]|uniref:B3 domain-containing protein n=1 Tax=Senna tora TaxID=362788 RepID=A0A834SJL3_9FABA|nr:B3 domain-containing protein [Senna tora]